MGGSHGEWTIATTRTETIRLRSSRTRTGGNHREMSSWVMTNSDAIY